MVSVAPTVVKDHLVISGVNIDMPVFLGTSEKILNKGGWLFPNTSRPELGGNTVIFGHRYMYRPPKSNTFWSLDKVNIGDEMTLLWKGREYRYKVFDIKIVEPTDLSVMNRSSDSILTVITCTPIFTTKQRLVVVGSLISVR
jgi:sortase A